MVMPDTQALQADVAQALQDFWEEYAGIRPARVRVVADHELGQGIFGQIAAEHARTRQALLAVTGRKALLDNEPVLQRAIHLRNPYVDPLNLIQVGLLRRLRVLPEDSAEREVIMDLLRLSIVGIAAGLKNTG